MHVCPLTIQPVSKKSMRGLNFSLEEDKLLVSARLNCSLDAVQGVDQKSSQLWEKIFEYFQQHKETTTERTIKSLTNRWSCIQKATNNFCSYLAQVEGLNQSGMTEQDKFDKAKIMYQSLEKCNFQFEHCWHLLKDQPKRILRPTKDVSKQWMTMVPSPTPTLNLDPNPTLNPDPNLNTVLTPTPSSSSSPSSSPSPAPNVIENEVMKFDQSMDRKAKRGKRKAKGRQAEKIIRLRKMKYTLLEESRAQEKEFYHLKAQKMEYDKVKDEKKLHLEEKRLRLEAEKLRIESEKIELAKKESDQRIMMMDVSVMPEIQRLYFEVLQKEILMRRGHTKDN